MVIQENLWGRVAALTPARIKATRTELGVSQEKFARIVGKRARQPGALPSLYTVSRWERGKKSPGMLWGPALLALVEESEARRAQKASGQQ